METILVYERYTFAFSVWFDPLVRISESIFSPQLLVNRITRAQAFWEFSASIMCEEQQLWNIVRKGFDYASSDK